MMDDRSLAIECLKIAVGLVSPSVDNRVEAVAQTQKVLYDRINEVCSADTLKGKTLTAPQKESSNTGSSYEGHARERNRHKG